MNAAAISDASIGAASLARPVDVVEVDPEGKLVDRKAHADPEYNGAHLIPPAGIQKREADDPRSHHRGDAPHQVVQVHTTLDDDASGPPGHAGASHQPRRQTDKRKRPDEADEHQEDELAAMVDELVVPEIRDERSVRDTNHCELRLAGGWAAAQPKDSSSLDRDSGEVIRSDR